MSLLTSNIDKNDVGKGSAIDETGQRDWDEKSRIQEEDELLGRSDENHDLSYETHSNETGSFSEFHTAVEGFNDSEEGSGDFSINTKKKSFVKISTVTSEDVDPFEDVTSATNEITDRKAISPIEWDRVSDEESENRDELHADVPGDEFSKEEEAQNSVRFSGVRGHTCTSERGNHIDSRLFRSTKYFLIKSNNFENIEIAKSRNVWATTKGNETRLNKAFFDYNNVLLIFSVRESGRFQGFARIIASSDPRIKVDWVLSSRMNTGLLSNPFRIKWISKFVVHFSCFDC